MIGSASSICCCVTDCFLRRKNKLFIFNHSSDSIMKTIHSLLIDIYDSYFSFFLFKQVNFLLSKYSFFLSDITFRDIRIKFISFKKQKNSLKWQIFFKKINSTVSKVNYKHTFFSFVMN